ncbi:MAG TPA: hypothetical protein VHG51_07715, partial [Longimicrobiaceae bacterium]|nr:hypothetical protein [Longimicrobiaceae bacterium]
MHSSTPRRTRPAVRTTLAALLATALLAAGCRRAEPEPPWAESVLSRLSLRARVAQMVVPELPAGSGA